MSSVATPARISVPSEHPGPRILSEKEIKAHIQRMCLGKVPSAQESTASATRVAEVPGVFGYASALNTNNTCGPASLATMMDFYKFGWSDIPTDPVDGHPQNEAMVRRVMDWSGAPDVLAGLLGTSPMRIQDTMNRLSGLRATWYANGTSADTISFIQSEIDAGRPIFILVDFGQVNQGAFILDWQVAYKYDFTGVTCKVSDRRDGSYLWDYSTLERLLVNNIPNMTRTVVQVVRS